MTTAFNFVRASAYHDSVTLMRLTADLEAVPGVRRAAAMMGTPHNRALLRDAGLLAPAGERAAPADLIIAILADDARAADDARGRADAALTARATVTTTAAARPRTLSAALRARPDADLVLVSVPGDYAAAQAMRALARGRHVMLFSDNVPLEMEVRLKRFAVERDLFVMGPDCGTAIINGVPLGFANALPRGRIGLAAASGTGLQEVACLVAAAGEGISHAIGLGGRDLSDTVGGAMAERALAVLDADPGTDVIALIGKPPGPRVAARLVEGVPKLDKPVIVHFAGHEAGGFRWSAGTLEDTARAAVAVARGTSIEHRDFNAPAAEIERLVAGALRGTARSQRFVRGVYAGGTLAYEARALLAARIADVAPTLTGEGHGHRIVDLGDDRFTVGRLHPMIDGALRREWIERDARDPATAVILFDLVLGHGAHRDPAGQLVPALTHAAAQARAARRSIAFVASVTGTEEDPQRRSAQVATLEQTGVTVMPSNAQAARLAGAVATRLAEGA